ncbi:MAG: type II secretion system protein [Planctomycetota bacterium]|nr:type II secretion system protein [Planctomycetota bacterium]
MFVKVNTSNQFSQRQESGITMIEILISVSIMAMMTSIFFTGVQEVRNRAKIQHCQNNLRELGMAFNMYDVRWTGKFPPTTGPDDDNLRPLYPSTVKSLDVFVCISTGNSVIASIDLEDNAVGGRLGYRGTSYDYHSYLLFDKLGNELATTSVKTRSRADTYGDITWLLSDATESGVKDVPDMTGNHFEAGGNVLFADSHVEWIDFGHWTDSFRAGNTRSY